MKQKNEQIIEAPDYNEYELAFREKVIKDLENSRTDREQNHPEFDDMTYTEHYQSNRRAGSGYNRPKQDEQDVRITTGTTQEKKNTLIAATLSLNLEPEIIAFDEMDREISELGGLMEDMVKKSREIDLWEDKRVFVYNEYYEQGHVLVHENYAQYRIPSKKIQKGKTIDETTWGKGVDKVYAECTSTLFEGINVYFGNIREPDIRKQPFVCLRDTLTRDEAKARFGTWKRWKNVPLLKTNHTDDYYWQLDDSAKDERIEILLVHYKFSNDFQIFLNGVMMLPVNASGSYPLSALLGVCEYPMSYAVSDPISDFAYGKSVPAKTKVDQAVLDNFIRNAVIKDNKHTFPPLANRTGSKISKRVYWAGHITDNLDAENLKEIGNNNGVDNATVAAIQLAKGNIDGKSVDPVIEGQSKSGARTAREIVELKEQSLQKMGLALNGIVSLERQMSWQRIQNILENWTKEKEPAIEGVKKAVYRTVSVETDFEDGTSGTKEIVFTEEMPDEQKNYGDEKLQKMLYGKNIRRAFLNPEMLSKMRYNWKVSINPVPKDSSEIRLAKFEESLKSLPFFMTGGKMPNMDYLGDRFAILQGENPDRFWQQNQPVMPMNPNPQALPNQPQQNMQPRGTVAPPSMPVRMA